MNIGIEVLIKLRIGGGGKISKWNYFSGIDKFIGEELLRIIIEGVRINEKLREVYFWYSKNLIHLSWICFFHRVKIGRLFLIISINCFEKELGIDRLIEG